MADDERSRLPPPRIITAETDVGTVRVGISQPSPGMIELFVRPPRELREAARPERREPQDWPGEENRLRVRLRAIVSEALQRRREGFAVGRVSRGKSAAYPVRGIEVDGLELVVDRADSWAPAPVLVLSRQGERVACVDLSVFERGEDEASTFLRALARALEE